MKREQRKRELISFRSFTLKRKIETELWLHYSDLEDYIDTAAEMLLMSSVNQDKYTLSLLKTEVIQIVYLIDVSSYIETDYDLAVIDTKICSIIKNVNLLNNRVLDVSKIKFILSDIS